MAQVVNIAELNVRVKKFLQNGIVDRILLEEARVKVRDDICRLFPTLDAFKAHQKEIRDSIRSMLVVMGKGSSESSVSREWRKLQDHANFFEFGLEIVEVVQPAPEIVDLITPPPTPVMPIDVDDEPMDVVQGQGMSQEEVLDGAAPLSAVNPPVNPPVDSSDVDLFAVINDYKTPPPSPLRTPARTRPPAAPGTVDMHAKRIAHFDRPY